MALPERFRDATFDAYEPRTPSQAVALRAAQEAVARQRRTPSWTERLRRWVGAASSRPSGLYLVGPAGTGKTHLLAATYHALTPAVSCAFLHSSTLFRQTEPPDTFAHRLADTHAVCCLDEVEIDDPANEMRLVQVMQTLAARDVFLVATSNVEPDESLSGQFSESRFERFLYREFRDQYRVVEVRGEDYRRTRTVAQDGHGWIGPPGATRPAMQSVYDAAETARWWTFGELRRAATETAHSRLMADLASLDHLFLEGVRIADTDDALRLLRIVDALYLDAEAPTLHFTADQPPAEWFAPARHAGVAKAVAEKFDRTVSRLHALCDVQRVGAAAPAGAADE
jgi:cell division protein ZapE